MKILVSTSATARQQANAKAVFGSKSVSILKALEEASKEKTLATPGLDALLSDLKLGAADFEKASSKAAFTKAVAAAKSFATAKTFAAKISALKAIKYTSAANAVAAKEAKTPKPASKLSSLMDSLFGETNSPAFKKAFGLTLPATAMFGVGGNDAVRTDGGYFYVQLEKNGPIAMLVSDATPYLDKEFLKVTRKPGQSVVFIDTNVEYENGEEGFGPANGYFNPDMSTVKVLNSDDTAIKMFKMLCSQLKVKSSSVDSANNIDHLYNRLQDHTSDVGDYSTDVSILTATIGKNSVLQVGAAADSDGQIGIHLVKHPADVYIINKYEAPDLFKSLASKALQANAKATYLICADKSDGGLFFSTKIKPVKESIKLFGPTDSNKAFDHLKSLCS